MILAAHAVPASWSGTLDMSASVYGCRGHAKRGFRRSVFHDSPDVHKHDPLAEMPNQAKIVRDEQVR